MAENSNNKRIVVVDYGIPELARNRLFEPTFASRIHHTLLPVCHLYQEAMRQNIRMVTPDTYFGMTDRPKRALLVSHLVTSKTAKLIDVGVRPTILTCQESPFVATRFYAKLKRYTSWFKHSFLFSGMARRVSGKTIYHQIFFPSVFKSEDFKVVPYGQKKFLTMISGNKRMGNWKKNLIIKFLYGLKVREIYEERHKAVIFFAGHRGFDLYGKGWDKGGKTGQETEAIKRSYRGMVEDKLPVLRQYKFTLCFENSVFPGYVTEKIFDAMFAGSVPVYLGAPDITDLVPKDAFVDIRDFKGLSGLLSFLENMDETTYNAYIGNIGRFLNSPQFYRFMQESFVGEVLKIVNEELCYG